MFDGLKKAISGVLNSFKPKEPKVGLGKELLAKVVKIKLSPKEIEEFSENLFLELLDADVPYEIAEQIKEELKKRLQEREFSDKYKEEIKEVLRGILIKFLSEGKLSIDKKPYVIVFIGPNGYGKTSSIAKLAYKLKESYNVGIIGADTFRAAARDQLKLLAEKAQVDYFTSDDKKAQYVIKKGLQQFKDKDVILVDTAGRQELNYNLMRELEAIFRNIEIDMGLYVLESTAGNAAFEQIQEYKKFAKIDGLILTKLDLDTRGGSILAAGYYRIPIYFITLGQDLKDLKEFNAKEFVKLII